MRIELYIHKATINAASMNEYGTVLNEVYHWLITKRWIL